MAIDAAREHRKAAREFAAWWADVATLAVFSALTGRLVHPARVAAADPMIWFDEEGLQHLPDIPEADRELAQLAANMAITSVGGGRADQDMAALAKDHAARVGLQLRYADNGQVVVKQDVTPEARRRRLWGDTWAEDRVPVLPTSDELTGLLASHGAPTSTIATVTEASRAVEDAVTALHRAQELEEGETVDEPLSVEEAETVEALWSQAEQLTTLLGRYARTLTNTLPVLRTGDQPELA